MKVFFNKITVWYHNNKEYLFSPAIHKAILCYLLFNFLIIATVFLTAVLVREITTSYFPGDENIKLLLMVIQAIVIFSSTYVYYKFIFK